MKNKVILATLLLIAFLFFIYFHFLKENKTSEAGELVVSTLYLKI